jgi:hypothetical protein
MRKPQWLNRDLLTSPVYYTLALTEADLHRELKRLKVPRGQWPEFTCGGTTATANFLRNPRNDNLCCIVALDHAKCRRLKIDREQVYAVLVHEAVHIWQRVKRVIGEDCPGDESEAYAIQRIAQSLMYEYKEQTAR